MRGSMSLRNVGGGGGGVDRGGWGKIKTNQLAAYQTNTKPSNGDERAFLTQTTKSKTHVNQKKKKKKKIKPKAEKCNKQRSSNDILRYVK